MISIEKKTREIQRNWFREIKNSKNSMSRSNSQQESTDCDRAIYMQMIPWITNTETDFYLNGLNGLRK